MRWTVSICALAILAAAAPEARADFLSGTIRVHGGASGGVGVSGDLKDESFGEGTRGGTYGARVGLEVLFLNIWLGHDQYVDQDGLLGTWSTLPMIGFDTQFDVGKPPEQVSKTEGLIQPKSKWFVSLGFGAGFGLGTGQQIELPLDNAEVSDKGVMFEGEFGLNRRLGGGLSFGITLPVQWRILFKNGADAAVNNPNDRYQEINASLLLGLRYKLKIF